MSRQEKIELLQRLQEEGVVRELCPVGGIYGTAYWHYEVVLPEVLPSVLVAEYKQLGELRW